MGDISAMTKAGLARAISEAKRFLEIGLDARIGGFEEDGIMSDANTPPDDPAATPAQKKLTRELVQKRASYWAAAFGGAIATNIFAMAAFGAAGVGASPWLLLIPIPMFFCFGMIHYNHHLDNVLARLEKERQP
jgi:hypothetical protein